MTRTVTRTVTRSSSSVEGADQLKANIANIADEISRVRDAARSEVDTLERIRGMLDVGTLNDLLRTIQELEVRTQELEDGGSEYRALAEEAQHELEQEQERLAKLWDAYKAQEDELERVKRDYPLMEEKLFERERTIETLRKEIARLEPLAQSKAERDAFEKENKKLQSEITIVERRLEKAMDAIDILEKDVTALRALEKDRHKLQTLESELEEERERLAKLYSVYESLEAEKNGIEGKLLDWEAWFDQVRPSLQGACSALKTVPQE